MEPERAPLRAAVYCTNEAERAVAVQALRQAGRGDPAEYDGVLEGWLEPDGVRALAERGIVVDPLDAVDPETAGRHEVLAAPDQVAADDPAVERLRATLGDTGPRVLSPEPEAAPEVAFYHIRLDGPITEDQRRAFIGYGVDLAAFEPPDSYRTRLTREQYGQVRDTPGVRAVERYRLEETLTRPLLETLEGGEARRTFDCVLHRIADRDRIVGELRAMEGVEVLDASYLFIRFSAPADEALLAAVARTPGVRRLDVYEPPRLMA